MIWNNVTILLLCHNAMSLYVTVHSTWMIPVNIIITVATTCTTTKWDDKSSSSETGIADIKYLDEQQCAEVERG